MKVSVHWTTIPVFAWSLNEEDVGRQNYSSDTFSVTVSLSLSISFSLSEPALPPAPVMWNLRVQQWMVGEKSPSGWPWLTLRLTQTPSLPPILLCVSQSYGLWSNHYYSFSGERRSFVLVLESLSFFLFTCVHIIDCDITFLQIIISFL